MRKFVIGANHFNDFLFKQLALSTAESESEFETALRLMGKLKDPAQTKDEPLTEEEQRKEAQGDRVFRFRRLTVPEATFLLEEDEWTLMKKRIGKNKTRVPLVAAEEFNGLVQAIEAAEPLKVKAAEAE